MNKTINKISKEFPSEIPKDIHPTALFKDWFNAAKEKEADAAAFCLSTTNKEIADGRYLLYKGTEFLNSTEQIIFVTNFESSKMNHISKCPSVSLAFYWPESKQQVRIRGAASILSDEISNKYFIQRSLESRLASILSKQSSILKSFEDFCNLFSSELKKIENNHPEKINITKRPKNWGAVGVLPSSFEFFAYGKFRLNNRVRFSLIEPETSGTKHNDFSSWKLDTLSP